MLRKPRAGAAHPINEPPMTLGRPAAGKCYPNMRPGFLKPGLALFGRRNFLSGSVIRTSIPIPAQLSKLDDDEGPGGGGGALTQNFRAPAGLALPHQTADPADTVPPNCSRINHDEDPKA